MVVAEQPMHKVAINNYDDQVIPTLLKGPGKKGDAMDGEGMGNMGAGDGDDGANFPGETKVDELSPENMKYAEQLLPLFGEDVVKKMFARPWAIREEGLKAAEDIIASGGNEQAMF